MSLAEGLAQRPEGESQITDLFINLSQRSSFARLLPKGRKKSQISQESILSDDSHLDDCFIPGSRNKGLILLEES